MRLSPDQLDRFRRDGVLVLPGLFSPAEVAVLRGALPAVFAQDTPANFREKDGSKVRTAMGIHLRSPVYDKLVRHPRFVEPARQILDDVSEFNGPLWFIRGSHGHGPAATGLDTVTTSYALWTVPNDAVGRLANAGGIVSAHGPAGTGLIFGDLMVHGSPANMSPWDRCIFSLILNPVANRQTTFKRPDFQHHRDFTAIEPLPDDCLLADTRVAG